MTNQSHEHRKPYTGYTDIPDDHLIEGFDPETALDLGIPVDFETLELQKRSAERVNELLAIYATEQRPLVDGQAEHDAVSEKEGRVRCANCNKPGCRGCGRS